MGNQQSKKQQAEIQPIKQVEMQIKQITPKQNSFVQSIQNENERNVSHRKSVVPVPDQNVPLTTSNNPAPRLSKKQPSKKQLPPLKLKNATSMKSTPLGNCENVTNQANHGVEQLEELQCQKGQKITANNSNDQVLGELDERESEAQKQNNEAATNLRAKKFRPSQQTSAKKTIVPSTAYINQARQASQLDEVLAV